MSTGESATPKDDGFIFRSDIEEMMFGFGDAWPSDAESAKLVETLVVQYIEDLVVKAAEVAQIRGQFDKECFMFLARHDRRKFMRICKLLETHEGLKKAHNPLLHEEMIPSLSSGNK